MDSVESADGRLGAVLSAPRSGAVPLGRHGPWLAASPALARSVLTDPGSYDFPGDVSRSGDLSGSTGDTRSGHLTFAALTPAQVSTGTTVFDDEWRAALADHVRSAPAEAYDAMVLLRRPVARSTVAAVLPGLSVARRDDLADRSLAWIDSLAPVIAAARPPRRWSRVRRSERDARFALEDALAATNDLAATPAEVATMLAAGIQVPIAAGAWLLAFLAVHPTSVADPVHAVWETLRLTPPTWVTARVTTREVALGAESLPAGAVVLVSPLLLGRCPDLVPGDPDGLADFDPQRWRDPTKRPGAWLPFGAGPHACPGRNLGLAQLTRLAAWVNAHQITLSEHVSIDQSRGIAPQPCRFTVAGRREAP
ncbi:cytochrome P450 [Nocardioides zhouii]|nr:cytochrome P450 [Nocardioides zhouii]